MKIRLRKAMAGLALVTSLAPAGLCFGADTGEDHPPEGTRSLFDYLFSKKVDGKWVYDVPTSFAGILERLRTLAEGEPLAFLVPMGRSVQRLDTDLKEPRVVATFAGDPRREYQDRVAPHVKGRLFFGFGARSDQLEVISYNERAGRFEFQLVTNLSKAGEQKVQYAPRQFCMSCHFHGVPIFPRNPWEETSAFSATSRAIEAARGEDTPYHGVALSQANSVAYEFDRITDASADLQMYQKMWREGCGGSRMADTGVGSGAPVECRALLLKLAFHNIFDFEIRTDSEDYKRFARIFRHYAAEALGHEIRFPIADLNTRNPLTTAGGFDPANGEHGHVGTDDSALDMLRQHTTIPPEFDPLSADPTSEDPYVNHPSRGGESQSTYDYPRYLQTLDRPKIRRLEAPETLNELINWVSNELLVDYDFWDPYYDYDAQGAAAYAKLDGFLEKVAAETREAGGKGVLGDQPFSIDSLLAAASRLSGDELTFCCQKEIDLGSSEDTDPGEGDGGDDEDPGPGLSQNEIKTLEHFAEFCLPCHSANMGTLGFFPGDYSRIDTEVARKILTKLDWERCRPEIGSPMPPAGHNRKIVCEQGDKRKRILETLRERYFDGSDSACGAQTLPSPKEWNWLCAN